MIKKITLTENELWDFLYKEICMVSQISKGQFAMSDEYDGFKRRFRYFLKKREFEEFDSRKKKKAVGRMTHLEETSSDRLTKGEFEK